MKTVKYRNAFIFIGSLAVSSWGWAGNKILKGVVGFNSSVSGSPAETAAVDVGDLDGDGIQAANEVLTPNGTKKVFYLKHRPIHHLLGVTVNGINLAAAGPGIPPNYGYHVKNGWICFPQAYSAGDTVTVSYEWSSDLDVVVGNGGTQQNLSYTNNGNFSFVENATLLGAGANTRDVAIADFNNDGRADMAFANDGSSNQILINNGAGFTASNLDGTNIDNSTALAVGDYDGDSHLDLAVANSGDPLRVYRNNGNGTFTEAWNTSASLNLQTVDFGDFDNDGDLDLLVGENSGSVKVYRNGQFHEYVFNGGNPSTGGGRLEKRDAVTMNVVAYITQYQPGQPIGIIEQMVVDGPYLYAVDRTYHVLVKLRTSDMGLVQMAGTYNVPGSGSKFYGPQGVAVDSNFVYVADMDSSSIQEIVGLKKDTLSNPKRELVGSNVTGAYNIAVDSSGAKSNIYLITYSLGGGNWANIRKYEVNPNNCDLTFKASTTSLSNPGQAWYNPYAIAFANGSIFVGDTGNNRIKKMDPSFNLQQMLSGLPAGPNRLSPGKNSLYVVNTNGSAGDKVYSTVDLSLVGDIQNDQFGTAIFAASYAYDPGPHSDTFFDGPIRMIMPNNSNMPIKQAQWVDYNNTGRLGFIVVNDNRSEPTRKAYMLFQNGGLNPSPCSTGITWGWGFNPVWASGDATTAQGVSIGDVNGDGYQDFVFTHESGSPAVKLYLNKKEPSAVWTSCVVGIPPTPFFEYKWGSDEDKPEYNNIKGSRLNLADFNGDGRLDLAATASVSSTLSGEYTGIVVYKNQKAGKKVIKITSESRDGDRKATVTTYFDVNEDGTLDKAIATEIK